MRKNNLKKERVLESVYTEMEGKGVYTLTPFRVVFSYF